MSEQERTTVSKINEGKLQTRLREMNLMPNLWRLVKPISRFSIFQDGGSHNLGFLKFYILTI